MKTSLTMPAWLRLAFTFACVCGGILAIAKVFADDSSHRAPPLMGKVDGVLERVVDGDTLVFDVKDQRIHVRMLGIDAPETHFPIPGKDKSVGQEPWGKISSDYLTHLLPANSPLLIISEGLDKYSRMLGHVFYRNHDVNLKMIQEGQAIPYIICSGKLCDKDFFVREHVAQYFKACDFAKEHGLGVFNKEHPLPEMPFEFRLKMSHQKPNKFVGDIERKELHAPNDYQGIDVCRRIFFLRESDALNVGFQRVR